MVYPANVAHVTSKVHLHNRAFECKRSSISVEKLRKIERISHHERDDLVSVGYFMGQNLESFFFHETSVKYYKRTQPCFFTCPTCAAASEEGGNFVFYNMCMATT